MNMKQRFTRLVLMVGLSLSVAWPLYGAISVVSDIHEASREGDIEFVRELLNEGRSVNARDDDGNTPLHLAASEGHAEIVKMLMERGADINARDDYGITPLHIASWEGYAEIAKILIEHGADIHARDIGDHTPLHEASWGGHTEIAKMLIEHGADIHARNNHGRTPFGLARNEQIKALLPTELPAVEHSRRLGLTMSAMQAPLTKEVGVSGARGAPLAQMSVAPSSIPHYRDQGRDRFGAFDDNPVKVTAETPVSTFSIDVDTASYGFMRASLRGGVLPPQDAVRVEEFINYFPYDYDLPKSPDEPFAVGVSLLPTPWNDATRLMHVGIKGYALARDEAPRANLVFLIDTSGSMHAPNKLPLVVRSFKLLLGELSPQDTVAIVTYAGSAGVALEPTPVSNRHRILASLEGLTAEGSTAGGEGIQLAYRLAEQNFASEGTVNRVILATDGDFNVGITAPEDLQGFIARKREGGIFLSVLGFGMGNYHDDLMQRLAQNGNGNAAYIDSLLEARKVLVEEATSTLFPIARDVKIQVEFNPALIREYRLIGYETRLLEREDFRDDRVDAGDVGAGHAVTALYEVTPVGSGAERIPPLRYQREAERAVGEFGNEFAFVKIRYKLPDADASVLMTRPVTRGDVVDSVAGASSEVHFAAAVAAFGQLLRGGRYTGAFGYDDVLALARSARGEDPFGYRSEFMGLVRLAPSADSMAWLEP